MASSSNSISQEVWEAHKNTILNLRYGEKLPLSDSKAGGKTVMGVMKDRYHFEATKWQYWDQMKKWGSSKYMKESDWTFILPMYDRLQRQGLDPRIRLGDDTLDNKRITRARRRYRKEIAQAQASGDSTGLLAAENRPWRVEFRNADGEYTEYSFASEASDSQHALQSSAVAQPTIENIGALHNAPRENQLETSTNPDMAITLRSPIGASDAHDYDTEFQLNQEIFDGWSVPSPSNFLWPVTANGSPGRQAFQGDPMWAPASPDRVNTLSPGLSLFHPASASQRYSPNELDMLPSSDLRRRSSSHDSSEQLYASWGMRMQSEMHSPAMHAPSIMIPAIGSTLRNRLNSVLQSTMIDLQDTRTTRGRIIDVQSLPSKLEFLLLESMMEPAHGVSSSLVVRGAGTASQITRAVMFAFINNMASLDEIPPSLLFGLIKADPQAKACFVEGLRSNDLAIAKSLADRAFVAAMNAGDADAVEIIWRSTVGRANEIDLNSEFDKRDSPLVWSIRQRHLDLIRKLLSIGIETHSTMLLHLVTERDWTYRGVSSPVQDDILDGIIESLLTGGATVCGKVLHYFLHAIKFSVTTCTVTPSYTMRLVQAAFNDSHWELLTKRCHKKRCPSKSTLMYLATRESEQATEILCDLFKACQSMGCISVCASKHPQDFNLVFCTAILRRNFGLASLLSDHIHPTIASLTIAIRTESHELVDQMLERTFIMRGPALCSLHLPLEFGSGASMCQCDWIRLSDQIYQEAWTNQAAPVPVTPLAEAIRLQDSSLVRRLEDYGALDRVFDEDSNHFEAAIIACVEIGDISYIKRLLDLNPAPRVPKLEISIRMAIFMGHLEICKILYIHGASRGFHDSSAQITLLHPALKSRNRDIAFFIIDHSDFPRISDLSTDSTYFCEAVAEAVVWGDRSIIQYMFELGFFSPEILNHGIRSTKERVYTIPDSLLCPNALILDDAVQTGDTELVTQLIHWGARADGVTSAVLAGDEAMVRVLVEHGAEAKGVREAIRRRDYSMLQLLLDLGASAEALGQAIEIEDDSVLHLLLDKGADPANSDAFRLAIQSNNDGLLHILSTAFKSKYPRGKPGFGFEWFSEAIRLRELVVLKRLLDLGLGTRPTARALSGKDGTLLHFAIQRADDFDIYELLERAQSRSGSKRNVRRRSDSEWNEIISLLIDAGADVETVVQKQTALLCAIHTGNIETVKLILSKGSSINRPAKGILRRTPLQQAFEGGDFDIVELLLSQGANVNELPAPNGGATALQLAAIRGSQRAVRLLLDKGADIHAAKAVIQGRTALEGAAEHGRLTVLDILLVEGAAGFKASELQSAKSFAEKRGHRGCAERLRRALIRLGDGSGSRPSLAL